jgi:hypothetical protein
MSIQTEMDIFIGNILDWCREGNVEMFVKNVPKDHIMIKLYGRGLVDQCRCFGHINMALRLQKKYKICV